MYYNFIFILLGIYYLSLVYKTNDIIVSTPFSSCRIQLKETINKDTKIITATYGNQTMTKSFTIKDNIISSYWIKALVIDNATWDSCECSKSFLRDSPEDTNVELTLCYLHFIDINTQKYWVRYRINEYKSGNIINNLNGNKWFTNINESKYFIIDVTHLSRSIAKL